MKRITNILSYLCLLLLLPVVACSDLEEIVVNMQGEEEVELTIQTNIPSLGGSTRTAPTENITSITALAFDSDHELIKVAIEDVEDVKITPSASPSTSGTYTVKVPVRTRRIHFIAKNGDAKFTEIKETDYGKSDEELLKDRLTTELHYWGKLDFANADELKSGRDVTLYRNMAKLNLQTGGENDYIAGLIHYNSKGTIAPYITTISDDEAINDFAYQDSISHYIPKDDNGVSFITTDTSDKNYGKVHYLFEEFNKKSDGFGEESDIVYVICNIGNKFYKVAFKPTSSSTDFYYIIRNKQYTIKIKEGATLGDAYAATEYEDALDLAPINNTKEVDIEILEEMDVYMFVDETGTATLNIPAGMSQLEIGYSQDNFAQGGVNVTNIAPNSKSEIEVTSENENGQSETIWLWIDAYKESLPKEQTTWTLNIQLKEEYINEVIGSGDPSILQIQFLGEGTGMKLNQKLNVHIMLRGTLGVTSAVSLPNKVGSEFKQVVNIPDFGGYDENFKLKVDDVESKYTITAPEGLQLVEDANGNYYEVEEDSQYTFTFALKETGTVGQKHTINFTATSEYHELTGTTTVTLVEDAVPDQDVYEIWVGNGNVWTGTTNSVEFFGYNKATPEGSFAAGTTPDGFRKDFYDTGANAHISQAMQMGSDDSFTFTIPAGDSRWLTMLVANDGGNKASIKLMQGEETEWTTSAADATTVLGTYNFGNGEIGTAGRLIRYELPAGTYTLKGSDADYLLYYMRVSKKKPETTDVAQPQLTDYNLSWSGGDYANTTGKGYLKISDSKHIVDEDNLTHTVSLIDGNSLTISGGESTFDLTVATTRVTFSSTDSNEYGSSTIYQYPEIINGSFALQTYNAGNYTLKGTIEKPNYKYSAFYDKLLLDAVQYEVKSPIMPGLYTSMDGDKLTPVNGFSSLDEAWAIGFLMPMVVPISASELLPYDANNPKYKNYTIDINIPNWTLSDEGDARGLGVIKKETYYYTLGTQENNNSQEMIHPREGWTYKIKWASIHDTKKIVPSLIGDKGDETKDTDHYFTYKGTIAKSVEIETPYTVTQLNIESLEFRSASVNGNGKTYNLNFGSDFYLKATISPEDANNYAGKTVRLNGSFSDNQQNGGNNAVHWYNSRKESSIGYAKNDGTALQFKVEAGKTEYEIHWQFERSNSDTGEVRFTYTVGNNEFTGSNSATATIVLNGNSQAVDNPLDLILDFYALDTNGKEVDNGVNGSYTDLQLGTSRFVLEVNIDEADALAYNGQTVYLAGNFETIAAGAAENGWAIHWVNSRTDGLINYYAQNDKINGSALQFKIDDSTSSYKIEWVFKTGGNYNGGEIGFDYKISAHANSPTKYNLSGDTQATIAFTNESQIKVATNGNQASNSIILSLEYGENSAEEFTVDVPVPDNVSGINISAPDYLTVSIGKLAAGEGYPEVAVPVNGNYTFTDSDKTTAPRFKFKLNGTPENQSVITFTSVDGNASKATVTVNWTQRGAESNQTTIWSGAMDLQWTRNYLEATADLLPAGTQVTLYFTTTGGQIKLHDSNETSISGDSGFAVTNGADRYSFTLQNDVNGLKINGNNVRMTSIVAVYPNGTNTPTETVVSGYDFEDGNPIVGWGGVTTNVVDDTDKQSKVLEVVRSSDGDVDVGQLGIGGLNFSGNYTVSMKLKTSTSVGTVRLVIQYSDGYNWRQNAGFAISGFKLNSWDNTITWDVTISETADQFVIRLEDVEVGTVFYIDDLKLVKKNN